jgi:hypothetical protein
VEVQLRHSCLGTRWRRVVTFTPRPLYPGERAPPPVPIWSWVNPTVGLDVVSTEIACPCQESNPGRPARSPSLSLLILHLYNGQSEWCLSSLRLPTNGTIIKTIANLYCRPIPNRNPWINFGNDMLRDGNCLLINSSLVQITRNKTINTVAATMEEQWRKSQTKHYQSSILKNRFSANRYCDLLVGTQLKLETGTAQFE